MRVAPFLVSALSAFALSSFVQAQDCDGDPGIVWTFPEELPIGTTIDTVAEGPPNSFGLLFASMGSGPTDTPWGSLCLDFPTFLTMPLRFPDSGVIHTQFDVPCDYEWVEMPFATQFVIVAPEDMAGKSNAVFSAMVDNGDCDACEDGKKPKLLSFIYTGDDCSASDNSQTSDSCSGDAAMMDDVRIVASQPNGQEYVWFDGIVGLGEVFFADPANAGRSSFSGGNIVLTVYDGDDNEIHRVEFHISCSQPLIVGDQFGAFIVNSFAN